MTDRTRGSGTADRVETAFTFALTPFSLFFIWQATQVPDPPRNIIVGPRTVPLLIGAIMLAAAVVLGWQRLRALRAQGRGDPSNSLEVVPLEEDETPIGDWSAVWTVLGSLLALFILLEPLGFVVAFALFIGGLSTFFAPHRWLRNLIVAVLFSVAFYALFTQVLGVPLPNGILDYRL